MGNYHARFQMGGVEQKCSPRPLLQQYQSANQVAECVREACPQGISRSSYSSFEQMSNEVLTSNQIALKGEKLEGNA